MLSQRIAKTLLQLEVEEQLKKTTTSTKEELAKANQQFDETLTGLELGKTVTGGDGKPVFLPALKTPKAKKLLIQAKVIWNQYKIKIKPVISSRNKIYQQSLQEAIVYSNDNNLKLLDLMNQITTEQQNVADSKAYMLQTIQISGLLWTWYSSRKSATNI